jgi:F-type H+-transporting ATPase subunit epsilon
MAKAFHVEIVTPQRIVFEGEAVAVTLPGAVAPFQVLFNHAPILSELTVGDIKLVDVNEKDHHFATSGGFVEVKNNRLTVIAETVEASGSIDVERAERARLRAEERIRERRATHDASIDLPRAEAALARANNRLRVAGRVGSFSAR